MRDNVNNYSITNKFNKFAFKISKKNFFLVFFTFLLEKKIFTTLAKTVRHTLFKIIVINIVATTVSRRDWIQLSTKGESGQSAEWGVTR